MFKVLTCGLLLAVFAGRPEPQLRPDDAAVPGLIKISDNVYVYQDYHSGAEKFTTNSLIVIRKNSVLIADGQGSVAATEGLVNAVATLTKTLITDVIICSEHGDHTGGNSAFPPGVKYYIHPNSQTTMKLEDAVKQANWGEYASWTLAASQGPIAVRKVYEFLGK